MSMVTSALKKPITVLVITMSLLIFAVLSIFSIPNYLNLSHTDVQCESNQKAIFIISDKDPKIAQVGLMFRPQHDLTNLRDESTGPKRAYGRSPASEGKSYRRAGKRSRG